MSNINSLYRKRQSRGFTLMEIAIAVLVLGVGMVGILAVFPTAVDAGRKVVENTHAMGILDGVSGRIGMDPYNYDGSTYISDIGNPSELNGYSVSSTKTSPVASWGALHRVTVTVKKNNRDISSITILATAYN